MSRIAAITNTIKAIILTSIDVQHERAKQFLAKEKKRLDTLTQARTAQATTPPKE